VWWVLGPITVAVMLGIVALSFIKLPYVAYAPGSAQSAEPLVHVPKGKGYDSGGDVLFLTVSVRSKEPGAQALIDWLDPDVDVQPYDAVYPKERDRKKDVAENRVAMTDSKTIAQQVAFEKLGYPVTVTGTGVIINTVADDLPVKDQLDPGDVITAVDGVKTGTADELTTEIRKHEPGDTVVLSVEAGGRGVVAPVTVKLSENSETHKPIIGVTIATRGVKYDFPFDVKIDSGNVIGPSGGLVFTLAIIDRLTPGSLTGGHKVAVTGEIASDGSVRPIGGVTQKLVAAERAGADAMIVPSDDYAEAKAHHSKTVKVYKADTIDEALAILKSMGGDTTGADHPLPSP
jgi:PDZ domain-containing protein